jgi:parvulin-like peptidyl-prolyl isomerase
VLLLSLALGCLQTSLLARPLYLDEAPPELRSARHLLLGFTGARNAAPGTTRARAEAEELGVELVKRARSGEDFGALVRSYSQAPDAKAGGVLGSFARGMLDTRLDEFLFAAEPAAISEPLETPGGWAILQRIDTEAAVLQIRIDVKDPAAEGAARARLAQLCARLGPECDFAKLAREYSDEAGSKSRGGQFAIYERGANDQLLKQAAFELPIGGISQPIRSPLGYHVLKRVAPGEVDSSLRENQWVRLRAILVQYDLAQGADMAKAPDQKKARELVDALALRIQKGEDMQKVAEEFNDDPGGKQRKGDLGWVHRGAPNITPLLAQAALLPVGQVSEPLLSPFGYLILRRER